MLLSKLDIPSIFVRMYNAHCTLILPVIPQNVFILILAWNWILVQIFAPIPICIRICIVQLEGNSNLVKLSW